MPGVAAGRARRVPAAGHAARVTVRAGPRHDARDGAERPRPCPLAPLDEALAAGNAVFGTSAITGQDRGQAASLARLRGRLDAICRDLPYAGASGGGVLHAASGMGFAELDIGPGTYLVGCGKARRGTLSPGRPANIVTGMCLFGADSVTGIDGSGQEFSLTDPQLVAGYAGRRLARVAVDERVHVYEAESAARLGSFIADLAGQLAPAPVRVHAHIPVAEYQLYGLSLYARGYLDGAQLELYRQAARRRGALARRMLAAAVGGAAELRACSPMSWLGDIDPYRIRPGALPQALLAAARRQDRLWQFLAGTAGGQPARDLGYASYVHHYLAAARHAAQAGAQLAVVENPDEEAIWRHAAAAGKRAGIPLDGSAGFYVHPRVVVRQTVFGFSRLLYNCRDGRDPRTLRAAGVPGW